MGGVPRVLAVVVGVTESKLWARLAKEARFGDFTSKHACSSGICLHAIIGDDYLKIARNMSSNLPNLRRLFVEARSDAEESAYSRNAFYNLVLFMSSVALFSLAAQKMHNQK
ncbi:hypothetical protein Q7P36_003960 [Cladosporium allicinum]